MPTLTSSDTAPEREVFWDRYKKEVMAVLILALLGVAAFGGYRLYTDRQANAAATMLAGEEASQQPSGTFVRSSQKAVDGTMLTGHVAVGMLSAGRAGTNMDEPLLPRVGKMFLFVHGSLPPFGRPSEEA